MDISGLSLKDTILIAFDLIWLTRGFQLTVWSVEMVTLFREQNVRDLVILYLS